MYRTTQGGTLAWNRARDIAKRLRELRDALGWTQEQFGEAAGVKAQQVSDWETGRTPPGRKALRLLAKELRISVASFEEGGPAPHALLQRPAEPRSGRVRENGAGSYVASGHAVGWESVGSGDSATEVEHPTGERARKILELRLELIVAEGRVPTPEQMHELWQLALWAQPAIRPAESATEQKRG